MLYYKQNWKKDFDMLLVITLAEKQFIVEVLQECIAACDDVESAVEECIEILNSLDGIREEDYSEVHKEWHKLVEEEELDNED